MVYVMKRTYIDVQKGKDLPIQTIRWINEIWQKVFPENKPLEPKNRKPFTNDKFFIVRSPKKKILSVGRLRPIKIRFLGKFYNIQGIADIVSVIKRRGYGKILMRAIYNYLSYRKQTGVGFCGRKNSPFYQKCGFKIAKTLIERFLYKNPQGKLIKIKGDVLYLSGNDGFIEKVLSHPKEKVLIPFPHW